ncbi:MAG TPA: SAM-dependent methyltransferase [Gammaproteobacteria bacterium]|nr:SAM-dependent methyltransferase [Gammaproteobacteria bacterium]
MNQSEHNPGELVSLEEESSTALLKRAYGLETPGQARALYRDWASTYDAHLEDGLHYRAPRRIAEMLADVLKDTTAVILDVGCGTGLVADHLVRCGFCVIDGLDFSPEMLAVADKKTIYRTLIEADLEKPLEIADGSYEAAICCGTFTHGHVGPKAMAEICRTLKRGAPFACTIHNHLWKEVGFAAEVSSLERQGIASLELVRDESYFDGAPSDGKFCVLRRH